MRKDRTGMDHTILRIDSGQRIGRGIGCDNVELVGPLAPARSYTGGHNSEGIHDIQNWM